MSGFGLNLNTERPELPVPLFGSKLRNSSGIDDFRIRQYNSAQGRFLSADPAQDGSNLYTFGFNNPYRFSDPSGATAKDVISALNPWNDVTSGIGRMGDGVERGVGDGWTAGAVGQVGLGLLETAWGGLNTFMMTKVLGAAYRVGAYYVGARIARTASAGSFLFRNVTYVDDPTLFAIESYSYHFGGGRASLLQAREKVLGRFFRKYRGSFKRELDLKLRGTALAGAEGPAASVGSIIYSNNKFIRDVGASVRGSLMHERGHVLQGYLTGDFFHGLTTIDNRAHYYLKEFFAYNVTYGGRARWLRFSQGTKKLSGKSPWEQINSYYATRAATFGASRAGAGVFSQGLDAAY